MVPIPSPYSRDPGQGISPEAAPYRGKPTRAPRNRIRENSRAYRVRLAWSRKDYSGAAEAAREGIRLEPWNTEYYARGAEVNFLSAMLMVQENQDLEGARGLLSETAAYPERIEEKNREVDRLDVETGLTM